MQNHPRGDQPLTGVPNGVWEIARERERVIRRLVLEPPAYGARSEVMAAAAAELGLMRPVRERAAALTLGAVEAAWHR